jgi:site-specific DNA recombinase
MQIERWQIVDEQFDDAGHSSETLNRPAMNRLIDRVRKGKIARILVHRLDRIARKVLYTCQFLELLRQYDVALTIVSQPEITPDANGMLLFNLMATFAEFEQDITRSRMADARAALKSHGRRVAGRVPYGYSADPITKQLVFSAPEMNRVRESFQWASEGQTLSDIATAANRNGWPLSINDRGNSKWTPRRISALLANRHYLGQIKKGDQCMPGLHQAIVDEDLFSRAHKALEQRRSSTAERRNQNQLVAALRGLVDCPKCGRKLSIGTETKRIDHLCKQVTAYYRCRSNAGGVRPCLGVRIPAWRLEDRVIEAIGRTAASQNVTEQVVLDDDVAAVLARSWQSLDSVQQSKLLPLIVERVVPTERFENLLIYLKPDSYVYVICMHAYGQPEPPAPKVEHSSVSVRSQKKARNRMISASSLESHSLPLRDRLKRVIREELFYDDARSTAMLMRRCGISGADVPDLMKVVAEDLLACDPAAFEDIRTLPELDGNKRHWRDGYLLASPTDDWIAAIVATRALVELKAAEAIPLFARLLFQCWRFPRLSIGIEAERFFALFGRTAIAPLFEAFEQSEEQVDDGRRNVAAALGWIGQKHPDLRLEIIAHLVRWLGRHDAKNIDSNSEIVCVLLDLKATEAAGAIRAALDARCIDVKVCGDWEEIRSELV